MLNRCPHCRAAANPIRLFDFRTLARPARQQAYVCGRCGGFSVLPARFRFFGLVQTLTVFAFALLKIYLETPERARHSWVDRHPAWCLTPLLIFWAAQAVVFLLGCKLEPAEATAGPGASPERKHCFLSTVFAIVWLTLSVPVAFELANPEVWAGATGLACAAVLLVQAGLIALAIFFRITEEPTTLSVVNRPPDERRT